MKAKKIIVMLLAMISLMCFGLSFNKVEAAESISKVTSALATDGSSNGVYIMTAVSGTSEYYVPNAKASAGDVSANSFNSSALKDEMYWNFTYDSANTCWKITSYTTSTNYLRFNSDNNGVNVGSTDSNNKYTITWSDTNSSYEVDGTGGRNLALYLNNGTPTNWRCYTSTSGIQKINLYKVTFTQDSPDQAAVDAVNAMMSLSFSYTKTTEYSGTMTTKYVKVTSIDELTDGTEVYLVGTNTNGTPYVSGVKDSNLKYLTTIKTTFNVDGSLKLPTDAKPVVINTGYTLSFDNQFLGSNVDKDLTFGTEPTNWSITFDSTTNRVTIVDSNNNPILFNTGSPRFKPYASDFSQGKIPYLYKAVQVQGAVTSYSNSEFVLKCGLDITATDKLIDVEPKNYGIFVKCGETVRYYDLSVTTGYNTDETNNVYYVNISLGDVLNEANIDQRATDVFTIGAYVQKTDNSYVLSTNTKEYSVSSMVEYYYVTENITDEAVVDLYNLLCEKGYIAK